MTKEDRERELSDINQKRISLGHLAGQLGGFVGESESVKKAVVNAIIAYFDYNSHLKTDLNDVYSSHVTNLSESDNSADQAGDTGVIGQLKQKVDEDIKRFEEQIKDIEAKSKLLNPSLSSPSSSAESDKLQSKLSALKTVKKLAEFADQLDTTENASTNILTNLCDGLETFLGFNSDSKGYTGQGIVYSDLDRLCDAVMGFLSGVLGAVKDDDAVKTYDKDPKDNIKTVIKKLEDSIGSGRTGLVDAVGAVKGWLEGYGSELKSRTNNVIGELGKLIHDKIGQYAIDTVSDHQGKKLEEQLQAWTSVLGSISDAVQTVETNVNMLEDSLKNDVMHEMKVIQKSVQVLRESAGKDEVKRQAERVDSELKWQKQTLLNNVISEVEKVQMTLKQVFEKVINAVQILERNKDERLQMIRNALENAKQLVKTELGDVCGTTRDEIYKHFDEIRHTITEVSHDLKRKRDDLQNLVSSAQIEFMKIQKGVGDKNKDTNSIDYNWEILKKQVNNFIGLVTNGKSGKLDLIVDGVGNYAAKFTQKCFEGIVQQWLSDVLSSGDAGVKDWFTSYVTFNSGKLQPTYKNGKTKIDQQLIKDIAGVIKDCLKNQIWTAFTAFEAPDYTNIATSVRNMQAACTHFATHLAEHIDKKIKSNEMSSFVDDIVTAIEKKVKNERQSGYSSHNLDTIITAALQQLIVVTRQVSKEMGLLVITHANLHTRLQEAMTRVNDIKEHVCGTTKGYLGQTITATLESVKARTYDLAALLKDSEGKIPEALKGLRDSIMELVTVTKDESGDNIGTVIQKRDASDGLMKKLANELQTKLGTLELALANANETLTYATTAVEEQIKQAEMNLRSVVEHLKVCLEKSINDAFEKLTTEVRIFSADSHLAHFSALKSLLTRQLKIITCAVNKNLNTGLKGFLKTLSGDHIDPYLAGYEERPKHPVKKEPTPNLLDPVMNALSGAQQHGEKVKALSENSRAYFNHIFDYLDKDLKETFASQPRVIGDYPSRITTIQRHLTDLLTHISTEKHFDHQVPSKLETLKTSVTNFKSTHFGNASYPVLDAFPQSLVEFVGELERMYVSRYEGGEGFYCNLVDAKYELRPLKEPETVYTLTDKGRMAAKVFLSAIQILFKDFWELYRECISDKSQRIRTFNKNDDGEDLPNALGNFFTKRGYKVPTKGDDQDGELRNKENDMTGNNIIELCAKKVKPQMIALLGDKGTGILSFLYSCLQKYYEVCHLEVRSSAKYPCNIYQMLQWLAGLRWHPVFYSLRWYLRDLFPTPDQHKGKPRDKISTNDLNLAATSNIKAQQLATKMLPNVCLHAHSVLTAIMGHGHAEGRYAVDFCTNADNLLYPGKDSDCFDMFVDVLERLYHQFRFLYSQCENGPEIGGWADCWYGRYVGGSAWNCNDRQCANQSCPQIANQKADQTGEQTGNQRCDQHPNCGLKSPLQSFLEDGLPGFLPHQFKKPGCKLDCSTANHRGIPCKTPMGFSDISQVASHTKTGADLRKILRDSCGRNSHLRSLCACLMCLLQKPPQTLGDMFAFYYNFIDGWNLDGKQHKKMAFEKAMAKANFGFAYNELKIHTLFSSSHSSVSTGHTDASLGSLVCISMPAAVCGPYLSCINHHISGVFSETYADKYLSWVVYLTESFYDLLKKLYDECNANCGSKGSNCFSKCCVTGCPTLDKAPSSNVHGTNCKTIVQCRTTLPTLCKYGFIMMHPTTLNGNPKSDTKRTCRDFRKVLETVLKTEKTEQPVLARLIYETIPNFLWAIRSKFFWLNVALWLLSLFYLLHIMVIRLDLLHIKSHLHSPSSHRIAAQSLLAAKRVNKLNRVFYLQP